MHKPFLSIITCTYNSEKYLGDCIQGIINQNLNPSDFEHIFVDGKSNDKTASIIKKYIGDHPEYTIKFITAEPKGVYNAMNTGIRNSDGDYLMFCNSDDYLIDNILVKYQAKIQSNQADVYYGPMNIVSENKEKISVIGKYTIIKSMLFRCGFNVLVYHPTTITRKKLFDELGYFNEEKRMASDYGFFLACIKAGKKFIYYPEIITNFRHHAGSVTSNIQNKQKERTENLYFRKKYLGVWGQLIHTMSLLFSKIKGLLSGI